MCFQCKKYKKVTYFSEELQNVDPEMYTIAFKDQEDVLPMKAKWALPKKLCLPLNQQQIQIYFLGQK